MLHVICGAPCAGKTTYVEQNAKDGDLIIDADRIASAFGGASHQAKGEPFEVALKARQTAIDHALKSEGETWLIDTSPSAENLSIYKQFGADVVVLDTPKETCLERAKMRPDGTTQAIEKWFCNKDSLHKNLHSLGGKQMEGNNTGLQGNEQNERTFAQAEVDAIVETRLKRERAKYADYDELKAKADKYDESVENAKSELQKATERADALQAQVDQMTRANSEREMRARVAEETGVPVSLLTGATEEDCEAQAKAILSFAKPDTYPQVKDKGESNHSPGKKTTSEQFAKWAEEQF